MVEHEPQVEELQVPVGHLEQAVAREGEAAEQAGGVHVHHALEEDLAMLGIPRHVLAGELAGQVLQEGQAGGEVAVGRAGHQPATGLLQGQAEGVLEGILQTLATGDPEQALVLALGRAVGGALQVPPLAEGHQQALLQGRLALVDPLMPAHHVRLPVEPEGGQRGVGDGGEATGAEEFAQWRGRPDIPLRDGRGGGDELRAVDHDADHGTAGWRRATSEFLPGGRRAAGAAVVPCQSPEARR